MKSHTVFITGASGYIGAMLCEQFAKKDNVTKIIGLDIEPMPEALKGNEKIVWITANTSDGSWQKKVKKENADIVIHTAWQIREFYGNRPLEWKWNIDGSDAVFDFAFSEPSVQRLVHFSTVASYGSFPENTLEQRFTEDEPFRKSEYLYAEEKRIAEEHLKERYEKARAKGNSVKVYIIRPAAITGPRGRHMRIRFGLQSALSGTLKIEKRFIYDLISLWVSRVPITPKWLRQYAHEDDITDIVDRLSFGESCGAYEAFNVAPPGAVVLGEDMAKAVGKKSLKVHPWMVRMAFFWMWHLTRGRVPTAPGSWRGYSYPIAVDGSKITKLLGYKYKFESLKAFVSTQGRYEYAVPEALRKS